MEQQPLLDHLYVAAYFLAGLGFAVVPFIISFFLAPRKTRSVSNKTTQLIECGVQPIGTAWVRFGIVYYLYALMFLAFDVDVLFLFPVAVSYTQIDPSVISDSRAFVEIVIFVGILSLAIIYAWIKGVFKWERKTYNLQ